MDFYVLKFKMLHVFDMQSLNFSIKPTQR